MNIFTKSVNGTSPSSSNATISSMVGFKIIKDTTVGGNMVTSGILKTTSTVGSTSSTTGALQVSGGAGVNGNVYVGGSLNVNGVIAFNNSTFRQISSGFVSPAGSNGTVTVNFPFTFVNTPNVVASSSYGGLGYVISIDVVSVTTTGFQYNALVYDGFSTIRFEQYTSIRWIAIGM